MSHHGFKERYFDCSGLKLDAEASHHLIHIKLKTHHHI